MAYVFGYLLGGTYGQHQEKEQSFDRTTKTSCLLLNFRPHLYIRVFVANLIHNFHHNVIQLRALLSLADGSLTVGWGKTFGFFKKMAETRKRKVERCEMNHLSGGYTLVVDKIRGHITKNGGAKNRVFGPPKTLASWCKPCSGQDREKLCHQKSTLFPNRYQSFSRFWACF